MNFELSENFPTKSVGELNTEFHKHHKPRKKFGEKRAANPIALILNPPQFNSDLEDKWFAVYYRHFFVTIEKGKTMFGPHIATLQIQIHPGNNVWLGTAQLKFNFFSRKELRKKLRLAIIAKKYFVSLKSAENIVEFSPPIIKTQAI